MDYPKEFQEALATGRVVVRSVFANKNGKDQMAVQFMQQIQNPNISTNSLIAKAQGLSTTGLATALFSFKPEVLAALKIKEGNHFESKRIIFGSELFDGIEPNIQIVENFTPNKFSKTEQKPKINLNTGEVIEFFGKPLFRHTELVAGNPSHQFMTDELAERMLGSVALAESETVRTFVGEETHQD
jgi:hypothetical protein